MKILIVGANSFLASSFTKLFHEQYIFDGVYNMHTDKIDKQLFRNLHNVREINIIKEEYDVVVIFSSFIPYGKFNEPNNKFVTVNIDLVSKVFRLFNHSHLIYCSSVSIYGDTANKIVTENTTINQPQLYGLSKLAGEAIIQNSSRHSILRFSSIYGKGMANNTFIPIIMNHAKQHGIITLFGDGSRLQNYIHADDASKMIERCITSSDNEIYLGVHPQSYSNKQIAKFLQEINSQLKITFRGEDNSPSYKYDASITYRSLDYQPNINMLQALKNIWNAA